MKKITDSTDTASVYSLSFDDLRSLITPFNAKTKECGRSGILKFMDYEGNIYNDLVAGDTDTELKLKYSDGVCDTPVTIKSTDSILLILRSQYPSDVQFKITTTDDDGHVIRQKVLEYRIVGVAYQYRSRAEDTILESAEYLNILEMDDLN